MGHLQTEGVAPAAFANLSFHSVWKPVQLVMHHLINSSTVIKGAGWSTCVLPNMACKHIHNIIPPKNFFLYQSLIGAAAY